jgi:hypothetical protein
METVLYAILSETRKAGLGLRYSPSVYGNAHLSGRHIIKSFRGLPRNPDC